MHYIFLTHFMTLDITFDDNPTLLKMCVQLVGHRAIQYANQLRLENIQYYQYYVGVFEFFIY